MARVKTSINGNPVEAEEVAFSTKRKIWGSLHLEDGTEIRVQLHITGLLKVCDLIDEEGNPAYLINGQTEMTLKQGKPRKHTTQ